jgi:fructokinase
MCLSNHCLSKRPFVFGEVLYDCFPDGSCLLGGAPFNVAWHLHQMDLNPLFITAVGDDTRGRAIYERMRSVGMDVSEIQCKVGNETGAVNVSIIDGQPSYEIVDDVAWDCIEIPKTDALSSASLLYHGSLALRHPTSAKSLLALKASLKVPVFVDLNIRDPWFGETQLVEWLSGVHWVKLNDHELRRLSRTICCSSTALVEQGFALLNHYQIAEMWLTCGAEGAWHLQANGASLFEPAPRLESIVDTVGAGDAFASCVIMGILNGWGMTRILKEAVLFAAKICGIQGAIPKDRNVYQKES